jgi:hypothetical protein
MPDDLAGLVDEMGRSADEIRDDRVEPLVDLLLTTHVPGLGDRVQIFMVPRERDGPRGLFAKDAVVPGEQGLIGDLPVLAEALLGQPAAERVVGKAQVRDVIPKLGLRPKVDRRNGLPRSPTNSRPSDATSANRRANLPRVGALIEIPGRPTPP